MKASLLNMNSKFISKESELNTVKNNGGLFSFTSDKTRFNFRASLIFNKIKKEEHEQLIGNYILQGKLGEGSFGLVHKCRSCKDNQTYVIKKTKT